MNNVGIYQIVHSKTGKRYVGQALNIERRWKEHLRSLSRGAHTSKYLQRAWDKYGGDSFTFAILELCQPDELDCREQHYLDEGADYNVLKFARSPKGVVRSAETRQRISDALKGKAKSASHRANLAAAGMGKVQSQESRDRKSATQKGRPHSPEHRAKLAAANKARTGYKHSPETIAKIKLAMAAR